jgi:hypothetical protein
LIHFLCIEKIFEKNPKAAYCGATFAINPFVEGDQMRARPSLLVVLIIGILVLENARGRRSAIGRIVVWYVLCPLATPAQF